MAAHRYRAELLEAVAREGVLIDFGAREIVEDLASVLDALVDELAEAADHTMGGCVDTSLNGPAPDTTREIERRLGAAIAAVLMGTRDCRTCGGRGRVTVAAVVPGAPEHRRQEFCPTCTRPRPAAAVAAEVLPRGGR